MLLWPSDKVALYCGNILARLSESQRNSLMYVNTIQGGREEFMYLVSKS